MFKVFVLCTVLVTISGGPTDNQNVDKVAVVIENELGPQNLPVPIEQILRTSISESQNEHVPTSSCTTRIDPTVEKQRIKDVLQEILNDEQNENNRILLWLLAQKLTPTTTTTTTAAPAMMPPAMMPPAMMPPAMM